MSETTKVDFLGVTREQLIHIAEECAKIMDKKKTISQETYTTTQIAKRLHLCKTTVQRHCEKGILPATKPGKSWIITQDGLDEYLKQN